MSRERKSSIIPKFMNSYQNLCKLQNTIPNSHIKIDSVSNTLDFMGDRLKTEDWKPLLEAIRTDTTLHFINIRSRHSQEIVEHEPKPGSASNKSQLKSSSLTNVKFQIKSLPFTNFRSQLKSSSLLDLSEIITGSVSKCLSRSTVLTGIMLEKIPLSPASLQSLTDGLEASPSVQQLALPFTGIGDDGCATLCHVLRNRLNVVWLNLSGCGITVKGVTSLCNLLKFQKLNRYSESWKQSLRYRAVDPNVMPGLRRLTVSGNVIGDAGAAIFVETIIDDLWLKALDLQRCGITMVGAEALLSLVKANEFLSVVDIRGNALVPNTLVAAIVQRLDQNNRGSKPEFQWLKEENKNVRGSSSQSSVGSRSLKGWSLNSSESRLRLAPSNTSVGRSMNPSVSSSRIRVPVSTTQPPKCLSRTSCQGSKDLSRSVSRELKALSLVSVLPDRARLPSLFSLPNPRIKSNSVKVGSTDGARPPWNCGSSMRRSGSDQAIRPRSGPSRTPHRGMVSQMDFMKYILTSPS